MGSFTKERPEKDYDDPKPKVIEQISRDESYIEISKIISLRGTCQRLSVGCVITQDNRIVSTGYNGSLNHHCEKCDIKNKCKDSVHAEANAIAFAAKRGISLEGSKLYCTHTPCYECSKLIIQAGIIEVLYNEFYGSPEGIYLLTKNGIPTMQFIKV